MVCLARVNPGTVSKRGMYAQQEQFVHASKKTEDRSVAVSSLLCGHHESTPFLYSSRITGSI